MSEEGATGDVRQFSRHLVANLTALVGLPDTHLETDIIFQNSFVPRSVAFNFSSVILKHFGGSAQVRDSFQTTEYINFGKISCKNIIISYLKGRKILKSLFCSHPRPVVGTQ